VTLPQPALLSGSVTDDGLPNGTLTYSWTQISGPGTTSFSDASSNVTSATFTVPGVYVLQLTASDSFADSSAQVTVTVNSAPVAQSQSITLIEDSFTNVTLQATDAENDSLTFTIVTPPAHGILTNPPSSNQYTYVPAADYFGGDSFSFVANDGHANSAAAT